MKTFLALLALLHLSLAASIVDLCPDSCLCQTTPEQYLNTSCSSYEFIKKMIPKQIPTIVHLTINNSSLKYVDPKLKYLKNLQSLELSNNTISQMPLKFPYLPKLVNLNMSMNNLKDVNFLELPNNLRHIDVSHNAIINFPKDWESLKHLQSVRFEGNAIVCDCDNVAIYRDIQNKGVDISPNLTCAYPGELQGRTINSVNCSVITDNLLDSMLADQGSGDIPLENANHDSLEEDFFRADDNLHSENDLIEEGSGFEGSGLIPIGIIGHAACVINCSTPSPVGHNDEHNASPPPDLREQVNIIFEDIFANPETTSVPAPAVKEREPIIIQETDKSQVEIFPTNDTVVGEMERAGVPVSDTKSTYIVIGLLVALVAFLALYLMSKKKQRNERRPSTKENGYGEEMKPLGKSAEAEPVTIPLEGVPLLNGQNGKNHDDMKPVPEDNGYVVPQFKEISLRDKNTLTPQPERVTIKAGEISDSIPKTPLLVHRQKNSDGNVVTTPISN